MLHFVNGFWRLRGYLPNYVCHWPPFGLAYNYIIVYILSYDVPYFRSHWLGRWSCLLSSEGHSACYLFIYLLLLFVFRYICYLIPKLRIHRHGHMISYAIARVLASRSLPSEAIYGGSTLMGVKRGSQYHLVFVDFAIGCDLTLFFRIKGELLEGMARNARWEVFLWALVCKVVSDMILCWL